MDYPFPYANVVSGLLVLVVGFGFHWIGQTISVVNWGFATRLGLQEQGMSPHFKVYEHAIASADATIGWIYGIAGIGLVLGTTWGMKLAWFPGTIMLYHAVCYWFWTANQRRQGRQLMSDSTRVGWTLANLVTGMLALFVGWSA